MAQSPKKKRRTPKVYRASTKSEPWQPAPAKPINPSSDRVIAKLPTMSLVDTLKVWANAIKILATPDHSRVQDAARAVMDAIENEWLRRRRHPELQDGFFAWPTTDAPLGRQGLEAPKWLEEGVLAFMHYRVGKTADLSPSVRRHILRRVFEGEIPPAFPAPYLEAWGAPRSAPRLQKMAECIASFTRNAKRRSDANFDQAVADWEGDLRFLHEEFYIGRFGFGWPSAHV